MTMVRKNRKGERGQILILCATCLIVLLLFAGLAIDFGFAYVTKANLAKAADAAALTAAKNTGLGQAAYTAIATSAFYMNYGNSDRDVAAPVITICGGGICPTDSLGDTLLTITATATIKPYIIGLLPAFNTLNISATSEARFARIMMTLVIDRTDSMNTNAPGTSLSDAVTGFIDDFDDSNDSVAMVSFANDQKLDFPMATGGFQTPITTAIKGIVGGTIDGGFRGATYSDAALRLAEAQENVSLGLTGNIVHVVVFFTDGNANTIANALTCAGRNNIQTGTWTIGGFDDGSTVGFMTTTNSYYGTASNCPGNQRGSGDVFYPLNNNPTNACDTQTDGTSACNGMFTNLAGAQQTLTWTNVNADALARAVADANAMRTQTPPIIVYAVGLHGGSGALNDLFLCQIANDPGSACKKDGYTFNPNTPQGEFVMASDYTQLNAAFQQVASDIRLRLLQ